jgi:hypothetical protein
MMTMKKKIFPRISTPLSAVVTSEEGIHLKVIALDTSQSGFSFQCSTFQRNSLTPGGCFIPKGRPVELNVLVELPFPNHSLQIKALCHVAFSRRIASDKCEIGMRYEEFDGDGYNDLIKFIELNSTGISTLVELPNTDYRKEKLCA